ncbi:bifunctional enoyl-CoA hydratase/phosphate acetyltransferase [Amphritea sp. 2_MG-2023]|jgi:phosphotransacetylase|uniref:bifunctional enoyl-CoA hydratase/phosphate acetyltransferase n=1 Tax=Amphritea TaxID=515417 RepID=UPI001C067D7F|nr:MULTISPECIES: bifunctional enoyl-CoA hydratase/phosphate acetyltransferase [Amphritea]MBU2967522.1 bifunctional enoyl-CoA hydratase/phosphate acetyltransferase [Amphritea atlantica]MDO6420528.1 bifunctional enoyl-CoA hydratase/phosphate acetyltransferase [Amphritea sp. 2_MG-2023]MDX2423342.1 bifunctional enoyl-CoA hydratase/phosphate acetyltransferase [Amphritea sp.]
MILSDKPPIHNQLEFFIEEAVKARPVTTAVVHPVEHNGLSGAIEAAERGLIVPILVGPSAKIKAAADKYELNIDDYELIDVEHSHAAAETAVRLIREARAETLMKGDLGTSELLSAVIHKTQGIRTERRLSHVFVLDVPNYHKPLMITDAAINVMPDLLTKQDIVQNAIDFCHALGIKEPKVAILAAVEKVKPSMPSTIDAASLCKMADRGQITGGILDGPLAFDNAISLQAAIDKHISSPVSGDADILLAPDLEAANMIAKQLIYLADAKSAGIALGARAPIILNSRAEGTLTRLASCALASHMVLHPQEKK